LICINRVRETTQDLLVSMRSKFVVDHK